MIVSIKSLRRVREKIGLRGTRQQKANFEIIGPFVQEIRARYPTMGAHQMVTTLRQDYSLKVPEYMSTRYPSTGNKLMTLAGEDSLIISD
jgi:hypothetical protein